MAAPAWTHFPHEGDVGVCGFGSSVAEAFENAARAMTAVVAPLESLESREDVAVVVEAPDLEILLVDWLNAVIYEMATRRMLFRDFRVESPAAAFAARHSASRSTGSVTPRRSS